MEVAQETARKNHPQLLAAQQMAEAAQQAVVQAKSYYYPNIMLEGVATESNVKGSVPPRLLAGYGLPPPPVAPRVAAGVVLRQLVTDFGRTSNLVASSKALARASDANVEATDAQVVLAVTLAYYQLLRAQQILKVAEETQAARQVTHTQIESLMNSGLRSSVDLSFAAVNLSDATLLNLDAKNERDAARAILSAAMGFRDADEQLEAREEPLPSDLPELEATLQEAISTRPDLRAVKLQVLAAKRFAQAERATLRPKIELVADVNYLPWFNLSASRYVGAPSPYLTWNAIAGVIVDVPIFQGFELIARTRRARSNWLAADQNLTNVENSALRDVRVSWLAAKTAQESLAPAQRRAEESRLALQLAQSRYDVGLGSIVELTEAQLNATRGAVGEINARINYQQRRADLDYQVGKLR